MDWPYVLQLKAHHLAIEQWLTDHENLSLSACAATLGVDTRTLLEFTHGSRCYFSLEQLQAMAKHAGIEVANLDPGPGDPN